MSDFNIGDTVRIGNGKVEYKIISPVACGTVDLESLKSGKKTGAVDVTRLTIITNGGSETGGNDEDAHNGHNVTERPNIMPAWEAVLHTTEPLSDKPYVLVVDNTVTQYKSFEGAAFALTRSGYRQHAAIDRNGTRLVKRAA